MENIKKIIPEISILQEGILSSLIEKNKLNVKEIIISNAILTKLEENSKNNQLSGELGLAEISKLKKLSKEKDIAICFLGTHLRFNENIAEKIRELAWEEEATIFTDDKIQLSICNSKSISVYHLNKNKKEKIQLENFFDPQTMSVHLKDQAIAVGKKGIPGDWKKVDLSKKKLTKTEIREISKEIIEKAKIENNSFIEIERKGSIIVQLNDYRIVITEPPFSNGYEITAIRPVAKLNLENYELDEKLKSKLTEKSKGVLIAGSPGEGKTTLARALAEFFAKEGKIVKTIESPRDMVLDSKITQYSLNHGDNNEIHDVLLLSRPDYTFFDEIRTSENFTLYADLRLAGIGMIGIVHATNPIDAIQRFIGKIELGIIPQVLDTVVFVKNGKIDKVLELKMKVKVPNGMTEADLARPVVEIKDFLTGKLEFEIYSYGEHTVVIPVEEETNLKKKTIWEFAEIGIRDYFKKYNTDCEIEFIEDNKIKAYFPNQKIAQIIGQNGKEIDKIEKELGLKIDVQELNKTQKKKKGQMIAFKVDIEKKNILFFLENKMKDKEINIFENDELLFQAKSSKKAVVKLSRKSALGKAVEQAIEKNKIIIRLN